MWANDATGPPSGELTAPAPRPWDYCFRELRADPVVRWPGELELTISSDCETGSSTIGKTWACASSRGRRRRIR
jgi:hypothetical protein